MQVDPRLAYDTGILVPLGFCPTVMLKHRARKDCSSEIKGFVVLQKQ